MPDLSQFCLDKYDVLSNERDQNPCEVARALADACMKDGNGPRWYPLFPLAIDKDEDHYDPPSSAQSSPCLCSMATYNLIQACAACQHPEGSSSTSWSYFSATCSATSQGYPYPVPYDTAIPAWALADSSAGSTDIRLAMQQAGAGESSISSATSASTSAPASSSISPTSPAAAAETSSPIVGKYDKPPPSQGMPKSTVIALVLVAVFGITLVGVAVLYIRKRNTTRRQGHRLGSTSDFTEEMLQKGSAFLPIESFLSRGDSRTSYTRDSRTSFVTNSASTRSRNYRHSLPPTSTTSQSSSFTFDHDSFDDSSISPFSNIHHPPGARVATRDNLHSRADSISTFSGESRQTVDEMSLMSSIRSPPSSTGATYGRGHDEEDLISLSSAQTRRSN